MARVAQRKTNHCEEVELISRGDQYTVIRDLRFGWSFCVRNDLTHLTSEERTAGGGGVVGAMPQTWELQVDRS